jgi:DNA-binding MarR family transcriptional regulator
MSGASRRWTAGPDLAGEFPLELTTYVFHLFAVVSRHREARLEETLRPLGLNLSRHRALSVIQRLQPCAMSEVADYCAVDRTTMTRTIDLMVAAGFVQRATPPEDRRQVILTLTELGAATCERSLKAVFDLNRELFGAVPEEEQRGVARAFEAVVGALVKDEDLLRRLLLRDGL